MKIDVIERESKMNEISSKYNIGFQEMVDFYNKASKSQIAQMEKIVKNDDWKSFKMLIKKVLNVELKG